MWTPTEFNSTENEFGAVVNYWCKSAYSFKDAFVENPLTEEITYKQTECLKSKDWYPPFDDCIGRFQQYRFEGILAQRKHGKPA